MTWQFFMCFELARSMWVRKCLGGMYLFAVLAEKVHTFQSTLGEGEEVSDLTILFPDFALGWNFWEGGCYMSWLTGRRWGGLELLSSLWEKCKLLFNRFTVFAAHRDTSFFLFNLSHDQRSKAFWLSPWKVPLLENGRLSCRGWRLLLPPITLRSQVIVVIVLIMEMVMVIRITGFQLRIVIFILWQWWKWKWKYRNIWLLTRRIVFINDCLTSRWRLRQVVRSSPRLPRSLVCDYRLGTFQQHCSFDK